jgi:class 3 adenylate cyclase
MADSSNRTLVCSIVFLDIVGYSKRSVDEQLRSKQAFNEIVGRALKGIAARDRIVLDTGDGAAITFLGDPEEALLIAMEMREAMVANGALPTRMGINLGPVRLIKDINNQLNIIGDGINVAQRVMGFAETGQLLVSRSFHEVVSCLSPEYANLFLHVGARTDKHVREHDVYAVSAGALPALAPRPSAASAATQRLHATLTGPGMFGLRRMTLLLAPLFFAMAWGATTLVQNKLRADAEAIQPPAALPAKPGARTAAPGAKPPAVSAAAAGTKSPVAPAKSAQAPTSASQPKGAATTPAAAGSTGKVEFLLIPHGEVVIDGRNLGYSPPLQSVDLPAGDHTIEFRYSTFRPHVERVTVRPGESMRIVHRFKG